MKHSTERILTTHPGSLPRPDDLKQALFDREAGQPIDPVALAARVRGAVADVVRQQVEAGVDVISDGEMSKIGFANYVKDRLSGLDGETPRLVPRDMQEYPEAQSRPARMPMPACVGPIAYRDHAALRADLANLQASLAGVRPVDAFICAASPGCLARFMANHYYPDYDAYLGALAEALRAEYRAIIEAGFMLQVDCPDLAILRHTQYADATVAETRERIWLHLEVLNHALRGIPPEQVRVHICWGNYPGPHHRDVPLRDILDLLLAAHADGLSVEAANPRHGHEWQVFEEVRLPEGKVLIPGVIDNNSPYIEHPELVAQRIVQYARLVGRENLIAGTDCGFSTSLGTPSVVPRVAYAKLATLAEGARLASAQLW